MQQAGSWDLTRHLAARAARQHDEAGVEMCLDILQVVAHRLELDLSSLGTPARVISSVNLRRGCMRGGWTYLIAASFEAVETATDLSLAGENSMPFGLSRSTFSVV